MGGHFGEFKVFESTDPTDGVTVPEGTCLLAYRGSIAHNMYIPSTDPKSIDDVDLMGIVVGDLEHYFGLSEWGSRGTKEVKQGKWDCVYYEIRKMFSLLLQGNPNVLSILWCKPEHYLHSSQIAREIISNRHLFVGKHVYHAFAGYAHQQLEKMETRDPADLRKYMELTAEAKRRGIHPNHKGDTFDIERSDTGEARDVQCWADDRILAGLAHYIKKGENIGYLGEKRKGLVLEHGYDCKNAGHLIRLLRMAKEFMATGELIVYRNDAAELLDIKRGLWSLEKVKAHAADLFVEVREARDRSSLPEHPDRDRAERLLVHLVAVATESFRREDMLKSVSANDR